MTRRSTPKAPAPKPAPKAPTCIRCAGAEPRSHGLCAGCTTEQAHSTAVDQGLEPTVTDPVVLRRLAVAVRRALGSVTVERKAAS